MQSIQIISRLSLIIRKWNQLSQFRLTSTKVIPIEKRLKLATFWRWAKGSKRQQVKDQQSCISVFVAYVKIPAWNLEHKPTHDEVFHAWLYGRFIEIDSNLRRKKLHSMNKDFNFLGGSFSKTQNQFRRESQSQHVKVWFFLKNRPIYFHVNSTSVIRQVKQNQLSFFSIKINKPLPAPFLSDL